MSKKEKKVARYLREQGNREARGVKQRNITFSLSKHLQNQGQTIEDWEESGLLATLFNRIKFIGQYTAVQARQNQFIKEYKSFPPNSEFTEPKQFVNVTWASMHITANSKEVVIGYIEEDVFFVIFLDKNHKFWPSTLKNT